MPLFAFLLTGILLVILLVVVTVFCFLWLTSLVAFVAGWRMQKKLWKWIGGTSLTGLTLVALLAGAGIAYAIVTEPRHAYERTFDEAPSADVTDIESDSGGFADSGHAYLRFHADEATFDRIMPKDMQTALGFDAPGDYPWPQPPPSAACYRLESGNLRGFASESFRMAYDPASKTVWYAYQGVD